MSRVVTANTQTKPQAVLSSSLSMDSDQEVQKEEEKQKVKKRKVPATAVEQQVAAAKPKVAAKTVEKKDAVEVAEKKRLLAAICEFGLRIRVKFARVANAVALKKACSGGAGPRGGTTCPKCQSHFSSSEMDVLWSRNPRDLKATCTKCKHKWLPALVHTLVLGNGSIMRGEGIWYCPDQVGFALREVMSAEYEERFVTEDEREVEIQHGGLLIGHDGKGKEKDHLPSSPAVVDWKSLSWIKILHEQPDLYFNTSLHFGSYAAGMHWAFARAFAHKAEVLPDFYADHNFNPQMWTPEQIDAWDLENNEFDSDGDTE
jgi:hypothetical protein